MSIRLLKKLGSDSPSSYQIQLMEQILSAKDEDQQILFAETLTEREKSCLHLAALGHSAREAAAILSLKKTTVDSYYQIIRKKLGCKNIAASVFKGIKFGYLHCEQSKLMSSE